MELSCRTVSTTATVPVGIWFVQHTRPSPPKMLQKCETDWELSHFSWLGIVQTDPCLTNEKIQVHHQSWRHAFHGVQWLYRQVRQDMDWLHDCLIPTWMVKKRFIFGSSSNLVCDDWGGFLGNFSRCKVTLKLFLLLQEGTGSPGYSHLPSKIGNLASSPNGT